VYVLKTHPWILKCLTWQVEYVKQTFDLTLSLPRFNFLFSLYNFRSVAQLNISKLRGSEVRSKLRGSEVRATQLENKVKKEKYPTLYGQTTGKRKRSGDDGGSGSRVGTKMSGTVFDDPSVVHSLSEAGYKIGRYLEANEWEISNPVCRHVSYGIK
jgi:hypothetical protein